MNPIELNDGTFIHCTIIDYNAFQELKSTAISPHPIPKFLQDHNLEVYDLNDRIIVGSDSDFYIYKTRSDLEKVLEDFETNSGGVEIMRYKNIYGQDFPSKTHLLIQQLLKDLNMIGDSPINEDLLIQIDQKLHATKSSEFNKRHYLHFVAVIGEVLIENCQMRWNMTLGSDSVTWSPYLLTMQEEKISFFVDLYEDIYINNPIQNMLHFNYSVTK